MSSNTLLTPTVIAREALMHLRNNLVMGKRVHRQYKNEFVKKIGDTITIRKPVKFEATTTADITSSIQDVTEDSTSITINQRRNVAWQFSSEELTLDIDEYSERYIQPACITLANEVDSSLFGLYEDIYNAVGTPGTTPSSFAVLGDAAQKLDDNACPEDNRTLALNPKANWRMADALKGLFVQDKVRNFVEKGYLARVAGMDIVSGQNVKQHTAGNRAGTPLVKGAGQSGSTLDTDGWTASNAVLKEGDVFEIAGVYAVNPITKESTGELMQFTVTADKSSDGSGEATVAISPEITTSGAYQNVSAAPADDAAITVKASHTANLAFHKNAFALVTVPLKLPNGASWKSRVTEEGVSIRVIKDYDIMTDVEVIRLDILYGVKAIYPELACRVMG